MIANLAVLLRHKKIEVNGGSTVPMKTKLLIFKKRFLTLRCSDLQAKFDTFAFY
jgi:hypothetical protein